MPSPAPVTRLRFEPVTGFEPITGFESLFGDESRFLQAPTLAEAASGVLGSRGHRVLAQTMEVYGLMTAHPSASTTMLLVAHADTPTLFNATPVQAANEHTWTGVNAMRRPMLDDVLANLNAHPTPGRPLTDYLTGQAWGEVPDMPNTSPLVESTRAAALAGWWTDRMAEGHTPGYGGSAHLLLGLLLTPAVLARLVYDSYDPYEPPLVQFDPGWRP